MILVTGGTGFIGGHLLERLSQADPPAKCLVRPARAPRSLPKGIRAVAGDLRSGEGLAEALDGVDIVIHLAGVTKALNRDDYYSGNARATHTLVRALAGREVRLVHVSSLAAIGPSCDGTPIPEDAEPHPLTAYGKSKLEGERIVRQGFPGAVIVRPPVVYGPRDTDVFQILKSVAKGLIIELAGGERWFSAIYAEDLADGLLAAAYSPAAAGGTYHLAHPKAISWTELELAAARIIGREPRRVRVPLPVARAIGYGVEMWSLVSRRPGIVSREKILEAQCRYWICDTRRAAAEIPFEARTSIESGLSRTLAWYKEAGWLKY
jgi:nucleoside-diphosphate-sugar epimerase